jgi:uncharacterized YigZ family protein
MNEYQTIKELSEGIFKDRGSKFIAYAKPVYSQKEATLFLSQLRKEHFKARHHCLAYRIGMNEVEERASDDGEPSGSAGMPILNQLKSFDLINVAVVVIRYFGGVKLGVSGLIQAYKTSTQMALSNATLIRKEVRQFYTLDFDYISMTEVMQLIKADFLVCTSKNLEEKGNVIFGFVPSENETSLLKMTAILNKLPIEAVQEPIFETENYSLHPLGLRQC